MMIATPAPTPAPTPAGAGAPPAAAAPGDAQSAAGPADDFMALLTEIVTGSASASASAETIGNVSTTIASEKDDDSDVDLANLIPFAVPVAQIELPDNIAVANADADSAVEALLGTVAKGEGSAQGAQLVDATLAATGNTDTKQANDAQAAAPNVTFADALIAHRAPAAVGDSSAQPTVNAPVGSPQWGQEVGARVSLMVQQGNHSASLQLSPEHLGPMEVRISIQNDQASVWFGAAHADTRAAIEHALPRLRELFASQGLSLADAGVFREPPREQSKQSSLGGSSRGDSSSEPQTIQTLMIRRLGLVDAYA
jgi:flagellar hook-length control protein FliK